MKTDKQKNIKGKFEIDILAVNGVEIVVVEVKTTLRLKDVNYFIEKFDQMEEGEMENVYGHAGGYDFTGTSSSHDHTNPAAPPTGGDWPGQGIMFPIGYCMDHLIPCKINPIHQLWPRGSAMSGLVD